MGGGRGRGGWGWDRTRLGSYVDEVCEVLCFGAIALVEGVMRLGRRAVGALPAGLVRLSRASRWRWEGGFLDYGAGETFSEGFVVAVRSVIKHYGGADEVAGLAGYGCRCPGIGRHDVGVGWRLRTLR